MEPVVAVLLIATLVGVPALVLWRVLRGRRELGSSPAERATFETLHTASLAAPPLRAGLTEAGAQKASRYLRELLGSPALAITDGERLLVYDGEGDHHAREAFTHAAKTLAGGRTQVLGPEVVSCEIPECPIRFAVVVPLTTDGRVVGSLAAYGGHASAGLVRATHEVANWVDSQLELAELDRSRTRLMEAEVRALRAQISPHFIYNSLTTIASFVRSDPDRSRELLLDFADFTRYSFRRHGEFTTLAEELRSIDRYLTLERARFGDQLQVTLRIAPEVLPVAVPFLCLQPLVENAVRHGLESKPGVGRISIIAEDAGAECLISVEDDGVGMEPDRLRRILAGDADERSGAGGVGLANVDERLRQVYGDEYGLVAETGKGAGTKVSVRLPKYHPGVSAR
ncbi:sensor histidine kinase [Streptosporangium roseum]|uniref:histidine kinase n=1 Tax=Streptosporangium roseum (strain ATCC 12428 / DSM 43021 / JCM 3005 / KCTC 9067 / NCIMB 10171 / NRRL 2505 / NI 9100) TaxID=479432 RepID=D2AYR5_STRRD|nr:histidine kinase [Streptosporangium roseum]ACZ89048.1 signal transduction histidine kinase, LytS [Streptosporangium roseum DSM 43021]